MAITKGTMTPFFLCDVWGRKCSCNYLDYLMMQFIKLGHKSSSAIVLNKFNLSLQEVKATKLVRSSFYILYLDTCIPVHLKYFCLYKLSIMLPAKKKSNNPDWVIEISLGRVDWDCYHLALQKISQKLKIILSFESLLTNFIE